MPTQPSGRTHTRGRRVFTLFVSFLAMAAAGCDTVAANPDARYESNEPRSTYIDTPIDVTIVGAVHAPDLEVRTTTSVAMASIRVSASRDYVTVVPRAAGTTQVELVDRGTVVDAFDLEVIELAGYRLIPGQALSPEFPRVMTPSGVIENHGVILTTEAYDTQGRVLLPSRELSPQRLIWTLTSTEPILVQLPDTSAGVYPFEVETRGGQRYPGALHVVAADDIVSLAIEWVVDEPRTSVSVTGVTADGRHIIGLDVVLEVDGVAVDAGIGRWLFAPLTPETSAALVARWNGLSATRTLTAP